MTSKTVGPHGGSISGDVTGGAVTVVVDPGTIAMSGNIVLCTAPPSTVTPALPAYPSDPGLAFFALDVPNLLPGKAIHISLVGSGLTAMSFTLVEGGGSPKTIDNYHATTGRVQFDAYDIFEYAVLAYSPGREPVSDLVRRPPIAGCFDEAAPNSPIDSRPAADYCKQFADQIGYQSHSTHNGDAEGGVVQLTGDDVFYFAGHSIGECPGSSDRTDSTRTTAVALMFWGTPDHIVDWQSHQDEASILRGPAGDSCLQYFLDGYNDPRTFDFTAGNQSLSRLRFAVLQACSTLHQFQSYKSIGQEMYDAGAGTVLGFDSEIQFQGGYGDFGKPGVSYRLGADIWAHTFWSSAALPGEDVRDAARRATNDLVRAYGGDFGYSSVTFLHHPGASWSLSPAILAP